MNIQEDEFDAQILWYINADIEESYKQEMIQRLRERQAEAQLAKALDEEQKKWRGGVRVV